MAFSSGPDYSLCGVRIGPPVSGALLAGAFARWFLEAQEREAVCYFSVYVGRRQVRPDLPARYRRRQG